MLKRLLDRENDGTNDRLRSWQGRVFSKVVVVNNGACPFVSWAYRKPRRLVAHREAVAVGGHGE